jgi:prepilin-type N-terminal cleavage/methylation domain-containing protein
MLGAMRQPPRHLAVRGHATGITLVEMLVTMAIAAILLAIALPSMRDFVARKRLEGIAQELVTDLRLLKSHQIQNRPNTGTAIGFGSNAQKTCYILFVKGDNVENCNCAAAEEVMCGAADALGLRPAPIRQVNIPIDSGVQLSANRATLDMVGYNGMPRLNRTVRVTLTSATAGEIRVSTNATGVPSICSVSGVFGAIQKCPP